jgi:2-polyprenyl-3-methyl-5-hydroxy-6-metoxy-1,4-benzoquinol methylase
MQSDQKLQALKDQLKTVWTAGDYGKMAAPLRQTSEEWLADQEIGPGQRVLDVACGTGQLAIPAARAGAKAIGLDLAPQRCWATWRNSGPSATWPVTTTRWLTPRFSRLSPAAARAAA